MKQLCSENPGSAQNVFKLPSTLWMKEDATQECVCTTFSVSLASALSAAPELQGAEAIAGNPGQSRKGA